MQCTTRAQPSAYKCTQPRAAGSRAHLPHVLELDHVPLLHHVQVPDPLALGEGGVAHLLQGVEDVRLGQLWSGGAEKGGGSKREGSRVRDGRRGGVAQLLHGAEDARLGQLW